MLIFPIKPPCGTTGVYAPQCRGTNDVPWIHPSRLSESKYSIPGRPPVRAPRHGRARCHASVRRNEMHPEDPLKADLFSVIVLLVERWADISFTVSGRSDCACPSLTASQTCLEDLCQQPFKSVPFCPGNCRSAPRFSGWRASLTRETGA
jgi:hypothetical protein